MEWGQVGRPHCVSLNTDGRQEQAGMDACFMCTRMTEPASNRADGVRGVFGR
jgi:hypothetical protein